MADIDSLAEKYFSSLNFTCKTIMRDKANFESLLGDQWASLPAEEQESLLAEHFMPPSIVDMYKQNDPENDLPEFYPWLKIKSGQKIVEDDEGEMWQDEHSGPFSWETSSQSEFSISDDMSNMESVKARLKDPKRPKSPRLMKMSTGGDAPRPGTLERSGSTDFHQLRHIWETHHTVTPDYGGEFPISGFLSNSQHSLNREENTEKAKQDETTAADTKVADVSVEDTSQHSSLSVTDSIQPRPHKVLEPNPSTVSLKSFKLDPEQHQSAGDTMSSSAAAASLATKEDDTDLAAVTAERDQQSMRDDINKLNEIKTEMEKIGSSRPAADEDILKKFGVTFSYGEEEPPPPTGSDIMATAALGSLTRADNSTSAVEVPSNGQTEAAPLPSGFDFLTAW